MGERAVPQLGSLDLRLSQGLLQHLSVYIPSSNFSKKKKTKTNATRAAGWEDPMCSTNFTVFQERFFHSQLQADPVVGSGWLGHIYLFIPYNDFFLEEPALSTPCPHIPHYLTTPNMSTHIWIPWKISFRQQVTPRPTMLFQLLQIDLGGRSGGMWMKNGRWYPIHPTIKYIFSNLRFYLAKTLVL